jgi:hypothetical protein
MTGKIDWDVVRPELRRLSTGDLLGIIGRAYELLDAQDLPHVLGRWVPLEPLRAAEAVFGARSLAEKAAHFHGDSLAGLYYDAFDVNSKNCTDLSAGTETWMDEVLIFFERATAASRSGSHDEARSVFELLWDLFDRVDRCEDIVFFGDEHGSWQVPVDHGAVLPAYFDSLAATASPEVFGPRVFEVIERHDRGQRDRHLAEVRSLTLSNAHLAALEDAATRDRQQRLRRPR